MGNLDALRDWGHAKDYVRMQWMMLQQPQADDFVIAIGVQYSVRQFIAWSAQELGITFRAKTNKRSGKPCKPPLVKKLSMFKRPHHQRTAHVCNSRSC